MMTTMTMMMIMAMMITMKLVLVLKRLGTGGCVSIPPKNERICSEIQNGQTRVWKLDTSASKCYKTCHSGSHSYKHQ